MQNTYPELNRWKGIRAALEGLPPEPDAKTTTRGAYDNFLAGTEAAVTGRKPTGVEAKIVFFMLGYRFIRRVKGRLLVGQQAPRGGTIADSTVIWDLEHMQEREAANDIPPVDLPEPMRTVWRDKMFWLIEQFGDVGNLVAMLEPVRDGREGRTSDE